jgi:flagellar basal body-associated protein FliL
MVDSMKRFIKTTVTYISIISMLVVLVFALSASASATARPDGGGDTPGGGGNPQTAAAATTSCSANDNTPKGQILQGAGDTGTSCSDSGVDNAAKAAVDVLSVIVGVASVIMILIGGFKYTTSSGDSNKIASAKNTLIYAIVGLVVASLAAFIVNAVIGTSVQTIIK